MTELSPNQSASPSETVSTTHDGSPAVAEVDEEYPPSASVAVLDAAETAFRLLTAGPSPLALDGTEVGHGLPERLIPLDELRDLLLSTGATTRMQEAAWVELVRAAQNEGPAWVVGAVGVALPGLRSIAGQLAFGYSGDIVDLDAEILAGFTERLKTIDPNAGMLAARLVWAAGRAGARLRAAEWELGTRQLPLYDSLEPPRPIRHPDLVLAEAVRDGVLSQREATVIGATRLEGIHLIDLPPVLDLSYRQVCYLREKAEQKLVAYITGQPPKKISRPGCESAA